MQQIITRSNKRKALKGNEKPAESPLNKMCGKYQTFKSKSHRIFWPSLPISALKKKKKKIQVQYTDEQ